MADVKEEILRVIKEEGGFQNSPNDSGNFLNGVNYGTKFGITPAAYYAYYRQPLQGDTIKNLTPEKAFPIYEKNYLGKIGGSGIKNGSIAALLLFTVVNSGTGQVKTIKQVMNLTAGRNVVTENTNALTPNEVSILNSLDGEKFFNNFKAVRESFYKNLAARDPKKAIFLKGWLKRLDAHVYISDSNFSGIKAFMKRNKNFLLFLLLVILVVTIYIVTKKK